METKKFNSNENARGGKNNTKTVLTASGLSAVAGAAGAAAVLKFTLKRPDNKEEETAQVETPVVDPAQQENQQESALQPQQPQQPQQPATPSNDNITTPQPVDSTGGTGEVAQPQPTGGEVAQQTTTTTTTTDDDIDPDLIAQQIAGSSEVDGTDIEIPNIISVDGMDLAYGPDGSEFTVAMFHTPDGGQYMLADTDGDGIYSDVFDLDGNYVGAAEGNLTASDLQEAADPTGTYMAYDETAPIGEDPTNDIVATDTHTAGAQDPIETGMPGVSPEELAIMEALQEDEELDVEDVLAQLLSSNEDSLEDVASREMVVDEHEEDVDDNDDNEEDVDDDDADDDIDDLDEDEA